MPPKDFFKSTNEPQVIACFGAMMEWVQRQSQFSIGAKAEFADVADGWLAAFAKIHDYELVTHEVFSKETRRKVPIPNVCIEFQVKYIDTFAMSRRLDAQFTWRKR